MNRFYRITLVFITIAAAVTPLPAATIYWDNSDATGAWNATTTNWDIQADGLGGDPTAAPGVDDIASFNISTLNDPQIVIIQTNQTIKGLNFTSTGTVAIRSNSNSRIMTVGSSGITKSGDFTGDTQVNNRTSGARFTLNMGDSQAWTNNATAGILSVYSGSNAILQPAASATTPTTLTLAGSNTGLNLIGSTLADGVSSVLSVVKDGPGTWLYGGNASATFSGGLTLKDGMYCIAGSTNVAGMGTGPLTLSGGTMSGYIFNAGSAVMPTVVNVTADSTIRWTRYDLTAGLTTSLNFTNSAFKSTGTPGTGPMLTFDRGLDNVTGYANVSGTSTINEFNGTFRFRQGTYNPASTSLRMIFGGTTAESLDGSNAKFLFEAPNDSTVGLTRFEVFGSLIDPSIPMKMGALDGSGYITFRGGVAGTLPGNFTLEVGHLGTNSVFTGDLRHFQANTISNAMGLNKVGAGSLTLSGLNDYLGGTKISNGTLVAGTNAGIAKYVPNDQVAYNLDVTSSVFTTRDATDLALSNTLADGDMIVLNSAAAADIATLQNRPLYVKTLSSNTFQLYTDPALTALATFTDYHGSGTPVTPNTGLRFTMPSSLGAAASASSSPIALGTGADANSVALLAGTAANPSVTIARDVNVAANSGGASTIGSTVDGNSVFSGTITLGKNLVLTSASTGANAVTVSGPIVGGAFGLTKEGAGNLKLTGAISYTGPTVVNAGTLLINNGLTTTLTTVSGAGAFAVGPTSTVNATSINVNSLSIGSAPFAAAVPEPGTWSLLLVGLLAAAGIRCLRNR
jgi:fibronectin-binding autotransporter adhesin